MHLRTLLVSLLITSTALAGDWVPVTPITKHRTLSAVSAHIWYWTNTTHHLVRVLGVDLRQTKATTIASAYLYRIVPQDNMPPLSGKATWNAGWSQWVTTTNIIAGVGSNVSTFFDSTAMKTWLLQPGDVLNYTLYNFFTNQVVFTTLFLEEYVP